MSREWAQYHKAFVNLLAMLDARGLEVAARAACLARNTRQFRALVCFASALPCSSMSMLDELTFMASPSTSSTQEERAVPPEPPTIAALSDDLGHNASSLLRPQDRRLTLTLENQETERQATPIAQSPCLPTLMGVTRHLLDKKRMHKPSKHKKNKSCTARKTQAESMLVVCDEESQSDEPDWAEKEECRKYGTGHQEEESKENREAGVVAQNNEKAAETRDSRAATVPSSAYNTCIDGHKLFEGVPAGCILVCFVRTCAPGLVLAQWNQLLDYFDVLQAKNVLLVTHNTSDSAKSAVACAATSVRRRIRLSGLVIENITLPWCAVGDPTDHLMAPLSFERLSEEETRAWFAEHPSIQPDNLRTLRLSDRVAAYYQFNQGDLVCTKTRDHDTTYYHVGQCVSQVDVQLP